MKVIYGFNTTGGDQPCSMSFTGKGPCEELCSKWPSHNHVIGGSQPEGQRQHQEDVLDSARERRSFLWAEKSTPFSTDMMQPTVFAANVAEENSPSPPGRSTKDLNELHRNQQLRHTFKAGPHETADTEIGRLTPRVLRTACSISNQSPAQFSYKMTISRNEAPPGAILSPVGSQCTISRNEQSFTTMSTEQSQAPTAPGEMMMCGQPCQPLATT